MRPLNRWRLSAVLAALLLTVPHAGAEGRRDTGKEMHRPADDPQFEPVYMGRTLSYWLRRIDERDDENMPTAFNAIFELGPAAWKAVPLLTSIVDEPFDPIRIGRDSRSAIRSKIHSIHLRADAVEGLGAIGEAAAPSAVTLIGWAFTTRVVPPQNGGAVDNALYTELVAIDVLERMRVAGAVSQFGPGAGPAVEALLTSPDGERRKFAVAILSERALPIATELLNSGDCADRVLGLSILIDMWPVVSREHINELKVRLGCE